jgi:hypothetical protein
MHEILHARAMLTRFFAESRFLSSITVFDSGCPASCPLCVPLYFGDSETLIVDHVPEAKDIQMGDNPALNAALK